MAEREPWSALVLYHLFKWSVVAPTFWWYLRGRVEGFEHVPRRGPFVAVCNHASDFDPPLVSCVLGRPVAYMAKEELFQVPVLGTLIRWYGAFPVRRGTSDRQAIQAALTALAQGWATGIFLSGTRTPDGRITEPKLGAALIAAKAQVPLLPVMLWGTHQIRPGGKGWPRPTPVTVRIAPPLPPPPDTKRETLERVTWECCRILNDLHARGR
ncbi:MAG: 1-acyl-sn-glycerol-3-phosphate acyltransferase [Gloeomargarita sp. SKYB31]|nr:1-acyl-sn-glycerol-3-phosphate acyltransferase [Gloeomargarita sp. SKYB31]